MKYKDFSDLGVVFVVLFRYKNQALKMYSNWDITLQKTWKSMDYVMKINSVNIMFTNVLDRVWV